jgi:hypothetical protein
MAREKANRALRLAKKGIRLGAGARCERCGATDLRVLPRPRGRVLCENCRLIGRGLSPYQRHHPAGRKNDSFIVLIPANDHAVLSDMQNEWPRETLQNPKSDPLHLQAAWLRGRSNVLRHQAEEAEQQAKTLEDLAQFFSERAGEDWGEQFEAWRRERGK